MIFSHFTKASQALNLCTVAISFFLFSCGKEEKETAAPETKDKTDTVSYTHLTLPTKA